MLMNSETIKHRGQDQSVLIGLVFGVVVSVSLIALFLTANTAKAAVEDKWADAHITGSAASPANAVGAANGTWAGSTNSNTSWTSRWAMENPTGPLTGTQTISVLARKGSNSGTPQLAINLYENGSLVQSIVGNTNVTSTTGQTISGTFDASVITDEANVEIQVVVTGVGGNPSTRNSAQIDEIEWNVNLMDAVLISGNVYDDSSDSSTTRLSNCDGLTSTMVGLKAGSEAAQTATCDTSTGAYVFSVVGITAGQTITVWINGVGGVYGTSVRRYDGSGNVTNLHIRKDRLVLSSDDSNAVTNTILDNYDNNEDTDIVFDVTSGNLTVEDGIRLIQSSSYTPGGNITTSPSSSGTDSVEDGDFIISSGTFNMGTNAISVGGDFSAASNITDSTGGSIIFTATASGHDITFNTSDNIENITIDGSGGGWVLGSNFTIAGVLTLTNGTLDASTRTLTLAGSGTPISKTSGVFEAGTSTVTYTSSTGVTALASSAMTGSSAFYNLTINSSGDTFTAGVAVDVENTLAVTGGTFALGTNSLTVGNSAVANSGSVKISSGHSLTQSATGLTTILSSASGTNCIGSSGASCVGTLGTISFGDLVIGNASTTFTTSLGGTNPSISADTITVTTNATLNSTSGSTLTLTGSGDVLDINGTWNQSTGSVNFSSTGSSGTNIPARSYYNLILNNASDTFTAEGNISVLNDMTITAGTFVAPADTLSIVSDFTNNGTYQHNNGTITFNPGTNGTSIISGSSNTNFYEFTATTARSTLRFGAGLTIGIEGDLTVTGESGKSIWIRSTVDASQWFIDLAGTAYLNYVNVKDSGCSSSANVDVEVKVYDQGNSGSCWKFIRKGGGGGPAGVGPGSSSSGSGGGGAGGGAGGSGQSGGSGSGGAGGGGGDPGGDPGGGSGSPSP